MDLRQELERHVKTLAQQIGERHLNRPKQLKQASDYIFQELKSLGYKPSLQSYEANNQTFDNIEAVLPGNSPASVLIGAHYDTVAGSPGADDNASGVAGVLALAKLQCKARLPKSIRFAFFANEEKPLGFTDDMGSKVYAVRAKREGVPIAKVIILEMIGFYSEQKGSQRYPFPLSLFYPTSGNFLAVVSDLKNRTLVNEVASHLNKSFPIQKLAAPRFINDIERSDHRPFWEAGIPALMITDTAEFRNENYHTASDRWDTLDYNKMASFITALNGILPLL